MNLIQIGHFLLRSGKHSTFKLECDDFIKENLQGLVELVKLTIGPFSSVSGVPRGGLLLASALEKHCTYGPHLLVEDVVTTGGSMERELSDLPYYKVIGVTVFARGKCPNWVTPLFTLNEKLWLQ